MHGRGFVSANLVTRWRGRFSYSNMFNSLLTRNDIERLYDQHTSIPPMLPLLFVSFFFFYNKQNVCEHSTLRSLSDICLNIPRYILVAKTKSKTLHCILNTISDYYTVYSERNTHVWTSNGVLNGSHHTVQRMLISTTLSCMWSVTNNVLSYLVSSRHHESEVHQWYSY